MKLKKALFLTGAILIGAILLVVVTAMLVYPPVYVYRTLIWQESDAFDWQKFPFHPLQAAPTAYHFESTPDPRVAELFQTLSGAEDWESFMEANETQAFIVIQDGNILYEKYFNHTQRDSIVTAFSVAKSFTSALVGNAIQEGYINFAKFGVLFLNDGNWQGQQVISPAWVEESTRPHLPENYADYYPEWFASLPGQGYYAYRWWGLARAGDAYDFTAEGDKGQFIYVSPQKNLVIVRHGIQYGLPSEEWLKLFYEFASRY